MHVLYLIFLKILIWYGFLEKQHILVSQTGLHVIHQYKKILPPQYLGNRLTEYQVCGTSG